jgi:sulfofructose kinase
MARILGIGAATLDHLYLTPSFSAEEEVTPISQLTTQGGGPVATALCYLSHHGHHCHLLDSLGDDDIGQSILGELNEHRIHTDHLRIYPGAQSPQAFIRVRQTDGARQICYQPSSAPEPTVEQALELLQHQPWDMLYVNGRHESAALAAAQVAQQKGIPICMDGGAGRYRASLRPLVKASSLCILALQFAQRYTDSESDPVELGPRLIQDLSSKATIVITDGLRGSHIWSPGAGYLHQPALPAHPTVDTTGCGDIYHAAFTHGHLQHWGIEKTAHHAAAEAAKNAQGLGGRWVLQPRLPETKHLSPKA